MLILLDDGHTSYADLSGLSSGDSDSDETIAEDTVPDRPAPPVTRTSGRTRRPPNRFDDITYDRRGRQLPTHYAEVNDEATSFLTNCRSAFKRAKRLLLQREFIYQTLAAPDAKPELSNPTDNPATYHYKDAYYHPEHWRQWRESMDDEKQSWLVNDIWEMVECPDGITPVDTRWVYKIKYNPDGSVSRFKSRLVARGFKQQFGVDFNETFAPVAKFPSIRLLFSLAAAKGWQVHQMDVKTAFLCSEIDTDVYVQVPDGLDIPADSSFKRPCMKLKKGLYGLRQSPLLWFKTLKDFLVEQGFAQSEYDHSVFVKDDIITEIYVDDILITGASEEIINKLKQQLSDRFEMVDGGEVSYFLGIQIHKLDQSKDDGHDRFVLSQARYTSTILKDFGMQDSRPVQTPIDKLCVKRDPESEPAFPAKQYQKAIGCLMYLMLGTRPDLSFAISHLSQFCADPAEKHWTAVKRVFRYLNGTIDHGLWLSPSRQTDFKNRVIVQNSGKTLEGYTDSDWASSHDRKSVGGYEFFFDGCLVSWASRKQTFVATSTMEAEYMAAANATKEAIWLANLTNELNSKARLYLMPNAPVKIFCDNQAAIRVSKNPEDHKRAKHIDISFHFLRQRVALGQVDLQYISTNEMAADYLTKPLTPQKFLRCRNKSGVFEYKPV